MLTLKQKIDEIEVMAALVCNDWEFDFIRKMKRKTTYSHSPDDSFTHKQASKINALYDKVCRSPF